MSVSSTLQWCLFIAVPPALVLGHAHRSRLARKSMRWLFGAALLGALGFALTYLTFELIARWAGLDAMQDNASKVLFAGLVVAPIAQSAQVASAYPFWRARLFQNPYHGALFPLAVAAGFGAAKSAAILWGEPFGSLAALRCVLGIGAHLALALLWGYALGKERRRRLGGRLFNVMFVIAVVAYGVQEHLVFARGPSAMLAATPLLGFMSLLAILLARDLHRRTTGAAGGRTRRFLRSIQPPSLRAMREALRRTERPLMLTWIAFGALVTTGVITAAIAGAVVLGHRVGVDFAAVDRSESAAMALPPLLLLGVSVLLSFPFAGFLIARASSTRTVLEPALSAALAIAGVLILLGFAAPVAVVFALACAPVAFSLACAGAWLGLAR